jgi:LysM repeat protein
MTEVTDTVGKTMKTGANAAKGVPPYVWLIAVGGGVLVAFYFNKNKGKTPDGTDTQAPTALVYTGTGQTDTSADAESSAAQGFQTNEAWAQAAKNWLIAQGVDAKEASDAVDLYINAQALNSKQNAMISNVTRAIGSPPQSLPPVTGTPTTPTDSGGDLSAFETAHVNYTNPGVTGASHLSGAVYTVKNGDTIDSIARKAYDFSSKTAWSNVTYAMEEIINANYTRVPDIKNLTPGTKLYIPLLGSQDFPGYGDKVPLYGYTGSKPATEWEFAAGIVPQSAATGR